MMPASFAARHAARRPDSFPARLGTLALAACALAMDAEVSAQDLEPRSYSNTPIGMNFLIAGFAYGTGNVTTDPTLPVRNADLDIGTTLLAYARALDVWGKSGKIDVVVP